MQVTFHSAGFNYINKFSTHLYIGTKQSLAFLSQIIFTFIHGRNTRLWI